MAKQNPESQKATETLEEIEGALDRVATWVTENPIPVLSTIGGILLIAAIAGGTQALQSRSAESASDALAEAQGEFLEAMGAQPGTLDIVEPANPERAQAIREEFVTRFLEVAEAHDGSAAAVSARLEAGQIQGRLGDEAGALQTFRAAAESGVGGALEAISYARLAAALEEQGAVADAADAWAQAAGIEHPTRDLARAQAVRLYLQLDDRDRAERIAAEVDPDDLAVPLPPHLLAAIQSLRNDAAAEPAG